jgi:hypothetical protein
VQNEQEPNKQNKLSSCQQHLISILLKEEEEEEYERASHKHIQ